MGSLYEDYLAGNPALSDFFASAPQSVLSASPEHTPWDASLAKAIRTYQASVGGVGRFEGDEAVVITGQQPGLFTGPLYTIYKAATAILLAERIERESGVPCVPMFWVASEDHDFEEVRTAHFLGKDHVPLSLEYTPARPVDGLPMHRVPLDPWIHEAIDEAAAATPGSEFRAEVAQFLHESSRAANSLSDWMARLMARLFRDTRLTVFSPHLPEARAAALPILEREIKNPLKSTHLLNATGARLEEMGYAQQVSKGEHECNFFVDVDGKRRKVLFQAGRYRLPEEHQDFSVEDMLTMLHDEPERFSPNVALRPVVQQHLFPTAAYVAGPGEIAYWAQLKPLFEFFGERMPVVYPRARCTLTNTKLVKLMSQFGFSLGDFERPVADLTEQAIRTTSENPTFTALEAKSPPVGQAICKLAEALGKDDAVARDMAEALARETDAYLNRIGHSILWRDGQHAATVERQVARLCYAFAPWRKPQERVYTVFSYVFEHGWGLIPQLLRELSIDSFEMNEVEL
jgi:bacillithiol synthase